MLKDIFRLLVKKETRFKITEFEFNSRKYTSLLRNWSHTNKHEEVIENEDCINKGLKRRSNSFVDKDLESLGEWLIVPFEWQIPIIIYDCHTKQGSHLKIEPTWEEIKASGFKWDCMYSDVRTFWHKWEICQISAGKLRKGEIVHNIRSNKPLERCQIDLVQLARILTTKPFKYLFTMVDHFSKYARARWIPDKKSITVIKALKSCLTTHNKPRMIQSDNGGEFSSREFKQFLLKYNIEHKFGPPYRPKWQGAVESFNKTIQIFLEMAKYQYKENYDLEDSVNDFLIYYNNRKHSTTGIAPYHVMRNANDEHLISKVKLKTEKIRQKIKRTVENYEKGQLVRISNHIQLLGNTEYIVYQHPRGLQKDLKKEKWEGKAIVIKK